MSNLRLAIFQFAPSLRDVAGNTRRVAEAAVRENADLLLTPELSLTGYDLRDDVHTVTEPNCQQLEDAVLAGFVERDHAGVPFNVAALIENGSVQQRHRKVYLPTYGMFDEGRYFGKGERVVPWTFRDWRVGVLICEDLWHPMLAYLHALQGADALVVLAAAPGRGVLAGGEAGGFFASSDAWQRIARAYAQLYGMYVIVCNRTGVEGGVTFGGESFAVAPDASVIAQAGIEETVLHVELDHDALRAARTPYAHIRDESVLLALRELQRITTST